MGDTNDTNPGVMDSANQILVLSFDLVGSEFHKAPEQLLSTLQSPKVESAIKQTLLDFAKARRKAGAHSSVASKAEADALLAEIARSGAAAAGGELQEKVKNTPEYKKLTASIEGFQLAVKSSSLGIWVDQNAKKLYIIGAGLLVGGATALYVTKSGGSVAKLIVPKLAGTEHEVLVIGKLHLKAGLWDFQPDSRTLGGRIAATGEWRKLNFEFRLGVMAEGAAVKQVEGEAVVKSGPLSVKLSGDQGGADKTIHLALNVDYKRDRLSLGLGAVYQNNLTQGQVNAAYNFNGGSVGLSGNAAQQKDGSVQYGAMANLTIAF